jgi:hypothetical protein
MNPTNDHLMIFYSIIHSMDGREKIAEKCKRWIDRCRDGWMDGRVWSFMKVMDGFD